MAEVVFRLELPQGLCLGVPVPETITPGVLADLDPEERAFLAQLGPNRQRTFAAGRLALRAALRELGLPDGPVLPDERGAPRLPVGALGSISHKRTLAVALAAPASEQGWALGVDLEEDRPLRVDIARRVLTEQERVPLEGLDPHERSHQVLARFSLKEAFYKAISGFVKRSVAFEEVVIEAATEPGPALLKLCLRDGFRFEVEAGLYTAPVGFILAATRVRPV